ncbi:MAG TPA: hypothetical protein VHF22_02810 [Planctomycetota bacterium]|nr:hypothetical protein [Planctomycetota bacterium]
MSSFVGLVSMSLPDRRILRTPYLSEGCHKVVISDSANVDAGGPRASMLRPGNVLQFKSATGRFVNDGSGETSAQATVTALIAGDATWDNATISVYKNGALVTTVALGAGDDTTDKHVTALNADAKFAANFKASNVGGLLTIQALEQGAQVVVKVTSTLPTAFGVNGTEARGTDGDYVVTVEYADQLNPAGSPAHAKVHTVARGHFDKANLVGLTSDAKSVLLRRGSRFE